MSYFDKILREVNQTHIPAMWTDDSHPYTRFVSLRRFRKDSRFIRHTPNYRSGVNGCSDLG